MYVPMIRLLFDYSAWADTRVLKAAEGLTPDQWLAPGSAGRGSIRDTLVHAIAAQRRWMSWLDGSVPPQEAMRLNIDPETVPDLGALRERWEQVQQQTRAFLERATEELLAEEISSPTPRGDVWTAPRWEILVHVANHNTQHRSEVAAMLTQFGHSPGDLDVLFYLFERRPPVGA